MITGNDKIIAGTVTGSAIEASVSLVDTKDFAFFVKHAGTTYTGTIALQYSMNGLDWDALPDSIRPIADGGTGVWSAAVNGANYSHVKLICTSLTGAITFTGWVLLKRVSNLG